jgi:hypothetical protein
MGCDIHAHVEIRYNGQWEHYATPSISRWYELFGIMAGVRYETKPIVEPKGVPADMSTVTRLDWERWGVDAHTASWFNEDEIDQLSAWLAQRKNEADPNEDTAASFLRYDLEHGILNKTYMFGNSLTAFKHYDDTEYLPKGCDAVRLIFWFDN